MKNFLFVADKGSIVGEKMKQNKVLQSGCSVVEMLGV